MSVRALLLLSCMHSLGLGLGLGNSLDRRDGENACAFTHKLQSCENVNDTQAAFVLVLLVLSYVHFNELFRSVDFQFAVPLITNQQPSLLYQIFQ